MKSKEEVIKELKIKYGVYTLSADLLVKDVWDAAIESAAGKAKTTTEQTNPFLRPKVIIDKQSILQLKFKKDE